AVGSAGGYPRNVARRCFGEAGACEPSDPGLPGWARKAKDLHACAASIRAERMTRSFGNDGVARDLLLLPRLLWRAGVHVNAERARVYLRAIAEIDLERPDDVRAASRTALVSRQADLAAFDVIFDLFWSLLRGARLGAQVPSARRPKAETGQIQVPLGAVPRGTDRKSTRLNSSHLGISYAVFCLKKKSIGHAGSNGSL